MKRKLLQLAAIGSAFVASTGAALADGGTLDSSVVTTQISTVSGYVTTIGAAAMGITGIFMVWRILRRGANRVG